MRTLTILICLALTAAGQTPWPRLSENYRHYCFDFNWVDKVDRAGKPLADYSKLSAKDHIDQLVAMHADSLMVFTMSISGYMFYDSKVGKRHPGLHYDYLKDMIRMGHEKGIAMELYVPTVWADWLIQQHPSWGYRTPGGELYTASYGGYHPDPNSPAADWYVDVIRELIPAYGGDAFFADGISFPRYGQSEFTVAKFKKDMGRDYPKSLAADPDWRATVRWEAEQVANYWKKLKDAVKTQDKRVEVTFNGPGPEIQMPYSGHAMTSPRLHSLTDYAFTEAGSSGEYATFVRGAAWPKPFKVTFLNANSILDPFDADEIRARVGRTLAEGGQPYRYDRTSIDGDANRHFTETWGVIFREVKEKEQFIKGAEPVKYVAVLASEPTMMYRGRADAGSHAQDLIGTLRALDNLHVQHDVIGDWNLSAEMLKPYQLVILPNAACMSDRQAAVLREYVREGGALWATAESSLFDENGAPRRDFALADVFGVRVDETPSSALQEKDRKRPAFLLPRGEHALFKGMPRTDLILPGDSVYVKASAGEASLPLILDGGAVVPSPGKEHRLGGGAGECVRQGQVDLCEQLAVCAVAAWQEGRGGLGGPVHLERGELPGAARAPWRFEGSRAVWASVSSQPAAKRRVAHFVNWQPDMPVGRAVRVRGACARRWHGRRRRRLRCARLPRAVWSSPCPGWGRMRSWLSSRTGAAWSFLQNGRAAPPDYCARGARESLTGGGAQPRRAAISRPVSGRRAGEGQPEDFNARAGRRSGVDSGEGGDGEGGVVELNGAVGDAEGGKARVITGRPRALVGQKPMEMPALAVRRR